MPLLLVKPFPGHATWFYVQSRTRPDPHVVKLESYRNNGECECEDFGYHFEDKLQRGATPDDKLRCDHIKAAREVFNNQKISESVTR